ncbi:Lipocalin-related protein and Bos/Can/Equ allergen [Ketogulonicigenium robustum]|uniref:Lipocalin-related protein and Bos/Can/Equ allergen n=1 Tax=Ketogulonicigenium robustum TaxID=92947 RepID=A0A1W6NXM1_9RHOB|nr:AI-2E family transporter [Ketogulonicigenium robustum]ARO13988.1 Lipocalin-related protein and Bos/Can/Equ allergen [Ketogulonicigenium robustum]
MQKQAIYWLLATVVFIALLYTVSGVLLPFVLGAAIAYLLDPVADKMERWGLSRVWAVSIISLVALLVVVIAILIIVPMLINQALQLVNSMPRFAEQFINWAREAFPELSDEQSTMRQTLNQTLTNIANAIQARGGEVIGSVVGSAMSVVSIAMVMFVAPVVAFYLLLDWDRMVSHVDELIPPRNRTVVRQIFSDIDHTLSAFIRGQGLVCVILGAFYAVTLMLAGLNFGMVIGFGAGMVSFIPYVGTLVGGVAAIGLGLYQFWGDWLHVGLIIAIFLIGQFLEGNVLVPKLMGGSVGLHPVWLIFAISVFGALFGFVGMLVAVPVAAVLGVLIRFTLQKYKEGPMYRGPSDTV